MAEPTFSELVEFDLHEGEQRYLTELEDRERAADEVFMAQPFQGHEQQAAPPGLGEEGEIRKATDEKFEGTPLLGIQGKMQPPPATPEAQPLQPTAFIESQQGGRPPGIPNVDATPNDEPGRFARTATGFAHGFLSSAGAFLRTGTNLLEVLTPITSEAQQLVQTTPLAAIANTLFDAGQAADQAAQSLDRPEYQKDFFDKLSEGAGSMAAFWAPAIATGGVSSLMGLAPRAATALGVSVATVQESFTEANEAYENLKPLVGQDEAALRAGKTLAANMLVIGITNSMGIGGQASTPLRQVVASMIGEGVQEVAQYDIQRRQFWLPESHPQAQAMLAHGWQQGEGIVFQPFDIKTASEVGLIGGILGGGVGFTQALALGTSNMREAVEQKIQALEATELGQQFMQSVVRDERGAVGRPEPGEPATPEPAGAAPVMPEQPLPESAVREGGKLKRVYHGTSAAFEQFDPAKRGAGAGGDLYGPGFYFTENPEIAGGEGETLGYSTPDPRVSDAFNVQQRLVNGIKADLAENPDATDASGMRLDQRLPEAEARLKEIETTARFFPNVRPAYLDIRKPFDIDEEVSDEFFNLIGENLGSSKLKQLLDAFGVKDLEQLRFNYSHAKRNDQIVETSKRFTNGSLYYGLENVLGGKEQATELLKELGYDGITHIGGSGENQHRVWIAFSPEQVIPAFSIDAALQAMRQPEAPATEQPTPQREEGVERLEAPAQPDQSTLERWKGYINNETGAIGRPGGEGQQSPADIVSRSGKPFKRQRDAISALHRENATETHEVAPVEGGFVGRAKVRTPIPPPPPSLEESVMQEQFQDLLTRPDVPASELQGRPDHINFDRINTADDVKQLIAKTREIARERIEEARRGTISREEIVERARENIRSKRFTIDRLLQRQPGEAFNAEDIMASRMLTVSLGQHFLSQLDAMDPNDSTTWATPFKTFNVWMQAAQELYGVTAEAGRGLNAFIPDATGEVQFIRELAGRTETLQTGMTVQDFKTHLQGTPTVSQLAEAAHKAPGYWDMFLELLYGIRLSGLQTHARNLGGNSLVYFWRMAQTSLASHSGENVEQGEALAMAYGTKKGLAAMLRTWSDVQRSMPDPMFTRQQRRQGLREELGERAESLAPGILDRSKVEGTEFRQPAITSENLRKAGRVGRLINDRLLGSRAVDFIGATARTPGVALSLEDTLFKVMNFQAVAAQLAYREGVQNRHLQGEELWRFVDDYMANLPAEAKAQAQQISLEQVFQEKLGTFAAHGEAMLNYHPAIRALIMFYRTPINLAKWSVRSSPFGVLTKYYRDQIKQGGAAADMARARIAMGTTLFLSATIAGLEGWIRGRGPSHPETRKMMEQGGRFQQYSIYVPGIRKWVALSATEPLGMLIGAAGDMAEIIKNPETWRDKDLAEKASTFLGANIMAATRNVTSKTWATGARDMLNLIVPPEYEEADESGNAVTRFVSKEIASLVPAFVAQMRRQVDPVHREIADLGDAIFNRLPFFSKTLPPARNIFAHIRVSDGNLGPDFISPMFMTDADKGSFVEREMARLAEVTGARFPGIPRRIEIEGKSYTLKGEEKEQYAALIAGWTDDPGKIPQDYKGPLETTIELMIKEHQRRFREPNLASERLLAETIKRAILASKKAAGEAIRVKVDRFKEEMEKRLRRRFDELPQEAPSRAPRPTSDLFRIGQ